MGKRLIPSMTKEEGRHAKEEDKKILRARRIDQEKFVPLGQPGPPFAEHHFRRHGVPTRCSWQGKGGITGSRCRVNQGRGRGFINPAPSL